MNKREECTFYLIRHGETEWNQQGLVQGHTDIPLSEAGVMQAQESAVKLKEIPFDAVFSSDLKRAEHTAKILIEGRDLPIITTPILREQSWGPWEGQHFESIKNLYGKEYNAYTEASTHRVPGVESHSQVSDRVGGFLQEQAVLNAGKTLLVVAHGGVLKGLIFHLGIEKLFKFHFQNLGYLVVKSDGNALSFVTVEGVHTFTAKSGL